MKKSEVDSVAELGSIGADVAERLEDNGIESLDDVEDFSPRELLRIKGIGDSKMKILTDN